MGSWGITERQSDYGLDLLGTIVDTQLKQAGFTTFNVADALDVVTADIMEEIRRANRGCSAENLVFYFGINFPQNFTHGALLIAECLADYYVELMVEVCCSRRDYIRIAGEEVATGVVKSRFLKLNHEHIAYVLDSLSQNTTLVKNIKAYTLAALYNAPTTIGQYYASWSVTIWPRTLMEYKSTDRRTTYDERN